MDGLCRTRLWSSWAQRITELLLFAESFNSKLCRAVKFTALCVLFFIVLITIGIFIPFSNVDPSPGPNVTAWEEIEYRFQLFEAQKGENLIVFIMNVLSVIGMVLLIFYTGYGMSSLPIGMIR